MKAILRGAAALLTAFVLLFPLGACSKKKEAAGANVPDPQSAASGDAALMRPTGLYGGALADAKEVRLALPDEFAQFAGAMEAMRDEGLELLGCDMPLQAEFCLAYVGGSVTAVRCAADELLAACGETVDADGLFTGWPLVRNISLNTPVPYCMEAVCAKAAGDAERAAELYELAALNPVLPDGTEALKALPDLPVSELREVRAALAAFETHIYGLCPADPAAKELCGYEFFSEYHLMLADAHEKCGEYGEAVQSCGDAVKCDPFDIDNFIAAALMTLNTGDMDTMLYYIDNGLLLDGESPNINALAALYWTAAGDAEAARAYLETARANGPSEELAGLCDQVEAALEGGMAE